jgi:hypothetical protein
MNKQQVLSAITNTTKPLVGQMVKDGAGYTKFITALETATGRCPVLAGFEYDTRYMSTWLERNKSAIAHWKRGGLVLVNHCPNNPWTGSKWRDITGRNLQQLTDPTTAAYKTWMVELAKVGDALENLAAAGIVVIFNESGILSRLGRSSTTT